MLVSESFNLMFNAGGGVSSASNRYWNTRYMVCSLTGMVDYTCVGSVKVYAQAKGWVVKASNNDWNIVFMAHFTNWHAWHPWAI